MDRRDHALVDRPAGIGMRNRIARPIAIDAAKGTILAPCKSKPGLTQAAVSVPQRWIPQSLWLMPEQRYIKCRPFGFDMWGLTGQGLASEAG